MQDLRTLCDTLQRERILNVQLLCSTFGPFDQRHHSPQCRRCEITNLIHYPTQHFGTLRTLRHLSLPSCDTGG